MSSLENIVSIFGTIKKALLLVFCFSIYKIVDSEYSPGNFKFSKISIGTIIKNPEILKLVSDHLKTKKVCKHVVKKFPFVKRYVLDRYKTQEMCDKAILKNGATLKSVPGCYKNQNICN